MRKCFSQDMTFDRLCKGMATITDEKKFVKIIGVVPKHILTSLPKFSTSEVENLYTNELKHISNLNDGTGPPIVKPGVRSIFQTNIDESGIESNDNKRLQLEIPDSKNCDSKLKCYLDICDLIDDYFKRYKKRTWSFGHQTLKRKHILFALPGCKRQVVHTDFKPCEGVLYMLLGLLTVNRKVDFPRESSIILYNCCFAKRY
jgi:hypothetical protein